MSKSVENVLTLFGNFWHFLTWPFPLTPCGPLTMLQQFGNSAISESLGSELGDFGNSDFLSGNFWISDETPEKNLKTPDRKQIWKSISEIRRFGISEFLSLNFSISAATPKEFLKCLNIWFCRGVNRIGRIPKDRGHSKHWIPELQSLGHLQNRKAKRIKENGREMGNNGQPLHWDPLPTPAKSTKSTFSVPFLRRREFTIFRVSGSFPYIFPRKTDKTGQIWVSLWGAAGGGESGIGVGIGFSQFLFPQLFEFSPILWLSRFSILHMAKALQL